MKILIIALYAMCCNLLAWDKVPDYKDSLYSKNGLKIESRGPFKNYVEIVYAPSMKLYGVSFYNYDNKDDQVYMPSGSYTIRGCEQKSTGIIKNTSMIMDSYNFNSLNKLFITCKSSIFVRIYNDTDEYATYRISK